MKCNSLSHKSIFKIAIYIIFIAVVTIISLYNLILGPQNLSEKASIPPLYPGLEWNLVKEGNVIYTADFSQGNLSLYSKTYYAKDRNLNVKDDIFKYYQRELKQRGWYELDKNYYKDRYTTGYFGKLRYSNVYSKFAWYPKQRRFLRIQVFHNNATGNDEFIIEYNTQVDV